MYLVEAKTIIKMAITPPLVAKTPAEVEKKLVEFPSIDTAVPAEEGGPIARTGFNYQDEIAVGFLIEMLEDSTLLKVHCETHDDIVLVRDSAVAGDITAEYVQVKAAEADKLWSLTDICIRKKGKVGTSIYEISLGRDKYKETSLFRMVTLRPVVAKLKPLTFVRGSNGREPTNPKVLALVASLKKKRPGCLSAKKHDAEFWLTNCYWDQRHSESAVKKDNLVRVLTLSAKQGRQLLPEPAEVLLNDLRARAKAAGDAKWEPDKTKKIITQTELRAWWDQRTIELCEGAASPSGGTRAGKMPQAILPNDIIERAKELRRDYSAISRTSRYAESEEDERLRGQVKSTVQSLRSSFVSGELKLDGIAFHDLCLKEMDKINAGRPVGSVDRSAFLKGCMYDIADRCLLRFERPPS